MFGGGPANPYDEIVAKATDENLTSENWEIILTLCDKVGDEGQEGAQNAVAAVIKRLAHRNPNVQLYALSLAESLCKNLGKVLHRELASKAFTQALERVITDRTTHDKVKRRALELVNECTNEFENDTSLGIMEDLYNSLKAKGYKFESAPEPLPPAVDDDIRRKEEEELQRVLEMSMQDRGGRGAWSEYAGGTTSSAAPAASSSSAPKPTTTGYTAPRYNAGYVPARTPSPATQQRYRQPDPEPEPPSHYSPTVHSSTVAQGPAPSTTAPRSPTTNSNLNIVTRVRALHSFEPSEPGELAFQQGDIIKVVDRGYKDWWRGQLKGRTGIFPVNYVEPMPEPTAQELAKEAEQEAAVFSQAVNVERLLTMLRGMDPDKDNLADNEEIQELYRSCMSLRPKIVKLIDKYSQKRADLMTMNETFIRARSMFDQMMEESLAKHTGVYQQQQQPPYRGAQYPNQRPNNGRPNPAQQQSTPAPQAYGWNPKVYEQPGYNAYPAPAAAYSIPQPHVPPVQQQPPVQVPPQQVPAQTPQPQQTLYGAGAAPYGQPQQPQGVRPQPVPPVGVPGGAPTPAPAPQPQAYGYSVPYGAQGANPYGAPPQAQPQQPQHQPQVQPQAQPQALPQQPQVAPTPAPVQQHQPLPQQQPIHQQPQQIPSQQAPQQQQPTLPQVQQVRQQSQDELLPSPYADPVPQTQPLQLPPTQPLNVGAAQQQRPAVVQQGSQYGAVSPVQGQTSPQGFGQPLGQLVQEPAQQQPQPIQPVQPQVQPQEQQPQPIQQQSQPEPVQQQQPQRQPTRQDSLVSSQPAQAQPQPAQAQAEPDAESGPPYVFDPARTYSDPNVQAWAQYYAQGGTDTAGAVYFVSVPGVTGPPAAAASSPAGAGASAAAGQGQGGADLQRVQSYGAQQQQQQQQPQQAAQPAAASSVVGPNATRYQLSDSGFVRQQQPEAVESVAQQAGASSLSLGSGGGSPPAQASTPSWVLPKKTGPGLR